MISEIIKEEEIKGGTLPFPKLMVSRWGGKVVLFTDIDTGTVVSGSVIGHYSDDWDICLFNDLELDTKIVLQNIK